MGDRDKIQSACAVIGCQHTRANFYTHFPGITQNTSTIARFQVFMPQESRPCWRFIVSQTLRLIARLYLATPAQCAI